MNYLLSLLPKFWFCFVEYECLSVLTAVNKTVNPPSKFVLVDANIYQNIYQNILEGWVEGVAIEHSVILWQARVLHDITTELPTTTPLWSQVHHKDTTYALV